MVILAFGITMNTKTGLGVSPIISIAYSVSTIWKLNFGNMTMALYCVFVIAQFIIRGKDRKWSDLLQIPVALLVSQLLNLFSWLMRDFHFESFWINLAFLILAILLTGLGVVLSVDMRLVPNPGDGIVQAISDRTGKSLGLTKNLFDIGCIITTIVLGLTMEGKLIGIGLGTVLAVIGVGCAIALFNLLLWGPTTKAAGLVE
ncbi:MAG: hypothetical protein J6C88_00005 [Lachnospiraceae bacterium]|nr:hypothetical protein [Lachnospiraceae bacterium]